MQTTPTIGLKSPEGTDPFLTQDFIDNWGAIDQAFQADRAAIAAASDADTLGGHPASYFYSPDNPPAGGGGSGSGGGGTTDNRPYTWLARGNINQSKAPQAASDPAYSFNGPRMVIPVSGILNLELSLHMGMVANAPAQATFQPRIDNAVPPSGLYAGWSNVDYNLSGTNRMTVTHIDQFPVTAGSRIMTFDFKVASGGGQGPVTIYFFKMRATLAQAGSTF